MSKHNQRKEDTQSPNRHRRKRSSGPGNSFSQVDIPVGTNSILGEGGLQAQADELRSPKHQMIQRNILAGHIGRLGGNSHMQRVMATLRQKERKNGGQRAKNVTPGFPTIIQRENGDEEEGDVMVFSPEDVAEVSDGGGGEEEGSVMVFSPEDAEPFPMEGGEGEVMDFSGEGGEGDVMDFSVEEVLGPSGGSEEGEVMDFSGEEAVPTSTEGEEEDEGVLGWIASSLETVGNVASARWLWDPINARIGSWEAQLDSIGEASSTTTFEQVLLVPVSLLFVILQAIVGTLDLIARLNPINLIAQGQATGIRAATGRYSRAQFLADATELGEEAFDLITLGLRGAINHAREGWREGNVFRITQAVGEFALAALAIFGIIRGVRARLGARRAAAAGAERPRGTGETVRGEAPTEPGPGFAERPTEPGPGFAERPTEPGRGFAERPTEPAGRPTEPARGAARFERRIDTLENARQLRNEYMSGEARGGWDAAYSAESMQAHWEGAGGTGRAPLAFVDARGGLVFDARRVGMPPEQMIAEGTRRRQARHPRPEAEIGERPTEPGAELSERPTEPGYEFTERPAEPGAEFAERPTEPASRPREAGAGPRFERRINTFENARQLRNEYMSGEARGGWNAAYSAESMQAHWEGAGGTGRAPLAFVDANGGLVFDATRVGMPPEGMLAEGTRRRQARFPRREERRRGWQEEAEPAAHPRIQAEILNIEEAQRLMQAWEAQGNAVRRVPSTRAFRRLWDSYGSGPPIGDPPIGYVNSGGGLVVNMEALRSQ